MNLLKKLCDKIKYGFVKHKNGLKKAVVCLLLTSAIAGTLTACNSNVNDNSNNSSTVATSIITRPSKSTTSTSSSKVSTAPKSSKSNSKSSVSTPSSTPNSVVTTPNTTEYSDLLFHILINDDVNSKIDKALEDPTLFQSAEFDSHPYSFLEKQGHDVENVKAGNLKCRTVTMIENNDPYSLYMAILVENAADVPYYTEYMLKIPLNYNEFLDYNAVHEGNYYQQFFINDQLCMEKPVEILSQINVTVESHHAFEASLNKERFSNNDSIGVRLGIGANVNILFYNVGDECSIHIFNNSSTKNFNMINFQNKSYFTFETKYDITHDIYDVNEDYSSTGGNKEDCINGIKKCTVFDNNNYEIVANADLDLENTLNNNVEESSNSNLEDTINSGV